MAGAPRSSCAGAKIARAHVAHLALAHQVVERAQGFRQRHERVAVVQLQQVDVVATDALRLVSTARRMCERPRPTSVGAGAGAQAHLGGHQHARLVQAQRRQRLAHALLGLALRVGIGRVDEVHASLHGQRHEPGRLLTIQPGDGLPDSGAGAEGHGAEVQARDAQAGAAERAVVIGVRSLAQTRASPWYKPRSNAPYRSTTRAS